MRIKPPGPSDARRDDPFVGAMVGNLAFARANLADAVEIVNRTIHARGEPGDKP